MNEQVSQTRGLRTFTKHNHFEERRADSVNITATNAIGNNQQETWVAVVVVVAAAAAKHLCVHLGPPSLHEWKACPLPITRVSPGMSAQTT